MGAWPLGMKDRAPRGTMTRFRGSPRRSPSSRRRWQCCGGGWLIRPGRSGFSRSACVRPRPAWLRSPARMSGWPTTLREARDQIVALKEEVDRLAQPPSGFGVFLEACEDGTADVFTGGRKMRVSVSPDGRAGQAAAGPGSGAERGPQRRHRPGLRDRGRGRHAQGTPRGRRPGAGDLARGRGARRPAGRAAARLDPARGRLAAARAAVRLRVRAHSQGRGRGAHPRGGAGHHLLRHRRARLPDRPDQGRGGASVPARGPVP